MNCPKCGSKNLTVTNSYSVSECVFQRRVCSDCNTVLTTQVIVVNVDPPRGQGASSLARNRLRDQKS